MRRLQAREYFRHWRSLFATVAASVLAALPQPSAAAESVAQHSPRATVTLISDFKAVAPGQTVRVGLRQKLAPHWHTYWKNPGDAGAPPEIKLTLPPGASASDIAWPGPDGIPVGPVRNFGYENQIVLPITVTVPATARPGEAFTVVADANWLVCEKECIPESGNFRLDLPVAESPVPSDGDVAAAFAATEARLPIASPWTVGLSVEEPALVLTAEGDGLSSAAVKDAFFYPADWGVIVHAAPQRLAVGNGRLKLVMEKGQTFDLSRPAAGLLAIKDGGGQTRWFEIAPAITPTTGPATPSTGENLSLWKAALFAFLGGLILNLMPCVFPVLAIKATSVAQLSGGALREVRMSGFFYTAGVLIAFMALAGVLLIIRAGGGAIGWGFQFQSPMFVAAMSWLMLAIGLNLSGVYEIGLKVANTGQSLTHNSGHAGSFFTGLLAVVVATPCTAPFMGVAIGTALTASPVMCLALFGAMGLGLAAPYAILGIVPDLARLLPRPGPWMLRLRQAMAFPMYASAAWLVWVLAQQTGDFGVMIALSGALLVGFAAWTYGIAQHGAERAWFSKGVAAAAVLGVVALILQLEGASAPGRARAAAHEVAEPFSRARLVALRQDGKPAFVNMTAAWCITCLVNERTTLSTAAVQEAFRVNGVTYLKGDWTNQDPEITAYLRSFNRDGLPFYVFYPVGGKEPVLLPSVLTEATVLKEVQGAIAN